ncbi:MAG TPA: zf-TFIIB domain-containing protein [Polyangia bacterium]|nr:zf-TFIIB domain-containing protein [Polyangia bacterium]
MSETLEEVLSREAELKRRLAREKAGHRTEAEKQRLRELHFMRCPKCGNDLEEVVLREVRIDKCFHCNGLWLDAGELDQLVERSHDDLRAVAEVFRPKKPG